MLDKPIGGHAGGSTPEEKDEMEYVPARIFGEVSTAWPKDPHDPNCDMRPIAQRWEDVVHVNYARGYDLVSWQLVQTAYEYEGQPMLAETIVGEFVARFLAEEES